MKGRRFDGGRATDKTHPPFVVIGGGNADWIFEGSGQVKLGSKNYLTSERSFGGSGFNCTARLLGAGYPAIPILSTGRDPTGEGIRLTLESSARRLLFSKDQLALFGSRGFFAEGVHTPQSVVLVEGDRRTIFAQKSQIPDGYKERIDTRLQEIVSASNGPPRGILVGHIHSGGKAADMVRQATICLLDQFGHKCPVVLNLGSSQIELGAEAWKEPMRQASVTLMNFEEALRFFRRTDCSSLSQILRWYREKEIPSVITLGRFGAVAWDAVERSMILAWPYLQRDEVVDSTGAGDAMAAGILAGLAEHPPSELRSLQNAMEQGRLWAAYACRFAGAARQCPSNDALRAFAEDRKKRDQPVTRGRSVEVINYKMAEPWLNVIDLAFH